MFCPKCGRELSDDVVFCDSCGYKVGDDLINSQKDASEETPFEVALEYVKKLFNPFA